jgi:hypothetical protein
MDLLDKVLHILIEGKKGQLTPIFMIRDGDLAAFSEHPKEIFLSHGAVTCGPLTRLLLTRPDTNEQMMTKLLPSTTPMRVWR